MELFKLIIKLIVAVIDMFILLGGILTMYHGYTNNNIPWMIFGLLIVIYTEIHSIYAKIPNREE